MALIADINSRVIVEAGGNCPLLVVNQKVIDAIIEFCKESLAWSVDLDPMYVTQDVQEYDLTPNDPYTRIHKVQKVELNNTEISPGDGYEMLDRVTMWLNSKPGADIDNGLEINVAVTPTRSATSIDDDLFETHYDTLVAGALGRLFRIPGKAWTNPAMAAYYEAKFSDGIATSKGELSKNYTNAQIRTTSYNQRSFVI